MAAQISPPFTTRFGRSSFGRAGHLSETSIDHESRGGEGDAGLEVRFEPATPTSLGVGSEQEDELEDLSDGEGHGRESEDVREDAGKGKARVKDADVMHGLDGDGNAAAGEATADEGHDAIVEPLRPPISLPLPSPSPILPPQETQSSPATPTGSRDPPAYVPEAQDVQLSAGALDFS